MAAPYVGSGWHLAGLVGLLLLRVFGDLGRVYNDWGTRAGPRTDTISVTKYYPEGHVMSHQNLLISSLIICLFVIGCGETTGHSPRAQAKADFHAGSWDSTIARCSRILATDPDDTEMLMLRGQAFMGKGEADLAIADYTEVIRLKPEDPDAFYYRALAYEKTDRSDLAYADQVDARKRDSLYKSAYPFESASFNTKPIHLKSLDGGNTTDASDPIAETEADREEIDSFAQPDDSFAQSDDETDAEADLIRELFGDTAADDTGVAAHIPETALAKPNVPEGLAKPSLTDNPLAERFLPENNIDPDSPLGINLEDDITAAPEIPPAPVIAPFVPPITTSLPPSWPGMPLAAPTPSDLPVQRRGTTGLPLPATPQTGLSTVSLPGTARADFNPLGTTGLTPRRLAVGSKPGPTLSTNRPTPLTWHANPTYQPGQVPPTVSTSRDYGDEIGTATLGMRAGTVALGPTALGPTALGPAALGPTALGPTALGPTTTGPTVFGPTASGPATRTNQPAISTAIPNPHLNNSRVSP